MTKLESSNRDTLSLLDSKSTAHDKLAEELSNQHQKTIGLRRELSGLEEKIQSADNTISAAKFSESALQQEVDLLKRSNEWFDSELKTKSGEYSKYRKEKGARIAELQRANEDATSNINSFQRTEISLRKRLEEVNQKAEDAFTKIQRLQEDATRTEESFRAELDSSRRLAELQKQSADTAKRRVQELDELMEQTRNDATEEISQAQAELETERHSKEAAEQKLEEMEIQAESSGSNVNVSTPISGTPRGRSSGLISNGTPKGLEASGVFSPAASRPRGGLNYTQLYTEYNNAKSQLDTEKRQNEKLSTLVDEMMRDMEQKEPEFQELQLEHARLESQSSQLSESLVKITQERDVAKKENRKWIGQAEGLKREGHILRQQLRDLGSQIKMLLVEVQSRSDGIQLSVAEKQHLQNEASGQNNQQELNDMSETGRFVSQRLVTYKNTFELQEKNSQLLHLTRQLEEQMEGTEAKQKQQQSQKDGAELETLRDRVERYKDEMKSMVTQSQSYIRERDMFRRMLSHRGQLPQGSDLASMFDQSVNGTPRSVSVAPSNPEESATSKQLSDHIKLLKELQSHFDAYRREASTDHSTLKAQLDKLTKDKGELQGEIARANSQVTLAQERYEMLQSNYRMVKMESEEMHKRSQSLAETAAKQDIRTQQVAEELIEARGLSESMRNENSNLRAEKELWRRIEARLSEDNRALVEERARVNKAISDTQSLFNERELSDSENRRQLNHQIAELESQLKSANRKVEEEIEESKRAALRREYESEQNRSRIDDLVKGLGNTKEELAAATSARDQFDTRVGELKIELRTAQDHAQVLQPRPTPHRAATTSTEKVGDDDNSLSREQELGIEVADLKRELDLAKAQLESAHAQVEQYKAISQASEEELQHLNETHDEFKEDFEKVASEKDAQIKELQQRVEEISNELSVTNDQLSKLRKSSEDVTSRLSQQKAMFDEETRRIKDESERHMEKAKFHQEDLKAQAEIAQKAQQSYENELVQHAEATRMLQKTRSDYNELRLEFGAAKADAEAARSTMNQNVESWSSTKDQYEREHLELKSRRDDVDNQNRLLHQQLENITSQISTLQEKRAATGEVENASALPNSDLQSLQEVIRYLRREKEIVDVQHELSMQESRRLKQQLDYSQSQLDEARVRLDQERQRQADQERSSFSHNKLAETINELNVFRESSVTLRNEARQARSQVAEKSKQVGDLVDQIEPLKASLRELENEKETSQGEMKLLQEDRDRWQQRTQNVLQKYDRVDPEELEGLKQNLSTLEKERDEATAEKQTLQERVDAIPTEIQNAQDDLRRRLGEQYKNRSRELSGRIKAAENDSKEVREELQTSQAQLEEAQNARDEAIAKIGSAQAQPQLLEVQSDGANALNGNQTEDGEVDEDGQEEAFGSHQERLSAAEARIAEETSRADQLQAQVSELETRSDALQEEVENLQEQLNQASSRTDEVKGDDQDLNQQLAKARSRSDELKEKAENLQQQVAEANSEIVTLRGKREEAESSEPNEHVDKVREDLLNAQKELDALRNNSSQPHAETQPGQHNAGEVPKHADKLKEELEANYSQKLEQMQEQFNNRVQGMRAQLNTKLSEGKNKYRDEVKQEHEDALATLKKYHEATETTLRQEHENRIHELKAKHKQDLENVQKVPLKPENEANQASTESVPPETTQPQPLPDTSKPVEQWNFTVEQARTICATNAVVREIIRRNIGVRLEKEVKPMKEESERRMNEVNDQHDKALEELRQGHAQELDESRQKADRVKEQAVVMESKKYQVKLSMSENKLRLVTAKLEIFEKAATDTPQKPVYELWAVAKDFKPPPAPKEGEKAQVQTPSRVADAQTPTAQQPPTPSTPAVQQTFGQPVEQQQPQQPESLLSRPPSRRSSHSQPTLDRRQSQSHGARSGSRPPSRSGIPRRGSVSQGNVGNNALANARPLSQDGDQQQQQAPETGPAALRGALNQGSGIPRGGGNVRGAAARRGGNQLAQGGTSKLPDKPLGQTHVAQNQRGGRGGARGAGGTNLSPQAPQFTPGGGAGGAGNKRQREDGNQGTFVPEKRGRGRGGAAIGRGGGGRARGGT